MQLFGSYTSPYVRHCRIVLARTGLECAFVETGFEQSAEQSPTRRVPFLRDGDLMLTDSASILKYLRERAGQSFFPDVLDYDLFLLANTALDSSVNLFMLEKDGVTPSKSAYLDRQKKRVRDTLAFLDRRIEGRDAKPDSDGMIRLGCFLSWALFRERLTLDDYPSLASYQREFESGPDIAATHPANSKK